MTKKEDLDQVATIALVQKHQILNAERKAGEIDVALTNLTGNQGQIGSALSDAICRAESLVERQNIDLIYDEEESFLVEVDTYSEKLLSRHESPKKINSLDYVDFDEDWTSYQSNALEYASRNGIDISQDPFLKIMSQSQRIEFEKRVKKDFTYKNSSCDKYDYLIAGTCGLVGGLIDILFVIAPGKGVLGGFTDDMTNKAVEGFAKLNGWQGGREGSNPTASAIGFLERKYKVNYDHRHGGDVDSLFKMRTTNHHLKSLAHSPDLVGLFFSILNQFTSTATFIDSGRLITIDTEKYELQGSNFVAKVFSGFINWLGHLFSDMAGSSGAIERGSGVPIPFYSLLQLMDFGEFGQHKQSFATVAVKVFEQGYDFRHGAAMAIPVMTTEILTRAMWSIKRRYYHQNNWNECIPSGTNPELRRMLLVAHGSLCLVDTVDATLRSGGTLVGFMLHSNLIAWARFGTLALKEVKVWYLSGTMDHEAMDKHLDEELFLMLKSV